MPFHVRDPWRKQYFEGVPCPPDVHIPIDDIDCWEWYPDYRYVYDKLHVARSQGVASGLAQDMPQAFPVFAKPRVNLKGMGLGSRIVHDAKAFAEAMAPGMMWMELFTGPHISTDCAVVEGRVTWMRHAEGIPSTGGMFRHWTIHGREDRALSRFLTDWIAREMPHYTGMINIETIGGRIIEAQIRFADQWCDLYGRPWFEAVVALYGEGRWPLAEPEVREGYSVPLFARHGSVPPHPSAAVQEAIRAMPNVSSLQITYHAQTAGADHPMPPGGFRLGIVNGWNLPDLLNARRSLAAAFPGVEMLEL
ncbi:MAG: hypothetical protein JNM45_08065 [Rhizobiales bacterium]|nr:hypothetical protein [Hyphomicrobiales bacterium]